MRQELMDSSCAVWRWCPFTGDSRLLAPSRRPPQHSSLTSVATRQRPSVFRFSPKARSGVRFEEFTLMSQQAIRQNQEPEQGALPLRALSQSFPGHSGPIAQSSASTTKKSRKHQTLSTAWALWAFSIAGRAANAVLRCRTAKRRPRIELASFRFPESWPVGVWRLCR